MWISCYLQHGSNIRSFSRHFTFAWTSNSGCLCKSHIAGLHRNESCTRVTNIMEKITIPLAHKIFEIPCDDIQKARQHMEVKPAYWFVTYGMIGFSIVFFVPYIFFIYCYLFLLVSLDGEVLFIIRKESTSYWHLKLYCK